MPQKYKYDIAFSFLFQDEKIAYSLNDMIGDRVNTFIYSKRQEELGGSDGEIAFNTVFAEQARTIVVLYRDGWGETPWTRIEETAIRNRAYKEGWNFITFILLENKSEVPKYLPKSQIWVDYQRWGLQGAASIIDQRIKDAGGELRKETIEDRVERFKRFKKANLDRTFYLNSQEAIKDSHNELDKILLTAKGLPQKLQDEASRLYFATNTDPKRFFELGYEGMFLLFKRPATGVVNFLAENVLSVIIYQKTGELHVDYNETVIRKAEYQFDQSLIGEIGWVEKSKGKDFINSDQIIEVWVKNYLDELEKRKIKKGK